MLSKYVDMALDKLKGQPAMPTPAAFTQIAGLDYPARGTKHTGHSALEESKISALDSSCISDGFDQTSFYGLYAKGKSDEEEQLNLLTEVMRPLPTFLAQIAAHIEGSSA